MLGPQNLFLNVSTAYLWTSMSNIGSPAAYFWISRSIFDWKLAWLRATPSAIKEYQPRKQLHRNYAWQTIASSSKTTLPVQIVDAPLQVQFCTKKQQHPYPKSKQFFEQDNKRKGSLFFGVHLNAHLDFGLDVLWTTIWMCMWMRVGKSKSTAKWASIWTSIWRSFGC